MSGNPFCLSNLFWKPARTGTVCSSDADSLQQLLITSSWPQALATFGQTCSTPAPWHDPKGPSSFAETTQVLVQGQAAPAFHTGSTEELKQSSASRLRASATLVQQLPIHWSQWLLIKCSEGKHSGTRMGSKRSLGLRAIVNVLHEKWSCIYGKICSTGKL